MDCNYHSLGICSFCRRYHRIPISGAHLNPAVTIGLATAGLFPWESVPTYLAGEMIGAMIGAFLVWLFYKDHFKITEDEGGKLACFSTYPYHQKYFF